MENLGYETHNSIILLGCLGLVAMYWITRVVFYVFAVIPFVVITKHGVKFAKKLKRQLFFGDLLVVTTEGYFEFLIAAYLNLERPIHSTNGEVLAIWMGWFSLFISIVFYPIICFIVIKAPLHRFRQ
jgi:hypothetical protein